MESVDNFNKGMDLDTNFLNIEKGKYKEANNIRLINDVGSTSYSVNNIKGNELNIAIPTTREMYKIEIVAELTAQYISIAYGTGTDSNITGFSTFGMTPETLYNAIQNDGGFTQLGVAYDIYYGDSYILIVPINSYFLTLTIGGAFYTDPTGPSIPSQSNASIIGSVTLRNDIYIFTTANTSKNPGGHNSSLTVDPKSLGQIWKYNYDKVTLIGTLVLIYNNFIDFSTYYAIPPTATTARYENGGTQRIYWTDNYNKLRSLNVSNPQSLALDASVLDIRPSVDFDIPILTDIRNVSGNTVNTGMYQCAYRLKNTGGAVTNYSELSNMVTVVGEDEALNISGGDWKNYAGESVGYPTFKNITWAIRNIDRDYDRIEVVIAYRENINDPHTIIGIDDSPIGSDEYTVTFTGKEDITKITLDEFLALSGVFTHCKTIGTKDNRLFIANIRNERSDVDFDCRAYRWDNTGILNIEENGVPNSYDLTTLDNIVEKSDAINPDESIYRYQSNGLTLGGEGINISYHFETIAIQADIANTNNPWSIPSCTPSPWRHTNPRYFGPDNINLNVISPTNTGSTEIQTYPSAVPRINDGFKYPHISGLLRGYQRGEVYRFGIQFYDKSKNPTFVKWIGDIKMPDFDDSNIYSMYEDGSPTGITDFRLGFTSTQFGQIAEYVQSIGIRFRVDNLETLSNQISGYSIVRLKREEKDRTIVCQGYILPVDFAATGSPPFFAATSPAVSSDLSVPWDISYGAGRGWFSTPELSNLTIVPNNSMSLNIKAKLTNVNAVSSVSTGGLQPYYFYKYYDTSSVPSDHLFDIEQMTYVGYGGGCSDDAGSGTDVWNLDYGTGGEPVSSSSAIGNPAFYFRVAGSIPWTYSTSLLLANIERIISNQYGGNGYVSRANSSYISCGHFRPVRTSLISFVDTSLVFGGDIFVNVYDSCRMAKNFGSTGRAQTVAKYSTTIYYPVESFVNTDLRRGNSMNMNFGGSSTDLCSPNFEDEFRENYFYNSVYSAENDLKTYFPKPDPFILNEEFDNRVHASEIKINGEFVDSWGTFKPNNYWDVEGSYGPINAMDVLRDKMYFWQNRAFGLLQINPRAVITDVNNSTNSQLQLGTGLPLQRHDYLSTEIGLQHQWGVTKSSYAFMWADVNNKKMFKFSEDSPVTPESDIKGIFSFLSKNIKNKIKIIDKPAYYDGTDGNNGVRAVYDFKYNQALFTFSDAGGTDMAPEVNNFTIAYDERLGAFTSFYGFTPRVYMSDGYKIFSPNPDQPDDIYMHDVGDYCKFYGFVYDSTIKMVVNEKFPYTKVFDNLLFDSQSTDSQGINYFDDTWNTIRIYNDYQNTDYQTLATLSNIKRKERTWNIAIPRNRVLYTTTDSPYIFTDLSVGDKPMGERIRDKYIAIDLKYNNANNRNLAFNNLRTIYRESAR